MFARARPLVAAGCGAIALSMLAACTNVLETSALDPDGPYGPTCRSTLGAYYLPRGLLGLQARATADAMTLTVRSPVVMVADRTQPLCLDYLSLPTARDIIAVQRDPNGLLTSISSDVTDRTPEIARTLIATGENLFLAAARTSEFDVAQLNDSLDVDFDPFNWEELIAVKKALRRFGYCIYVEGVTFPVVPGDPAQAITAGQNWCSAATPPRPHHPAFESFAALPVSPDVVARGVLYRPNMTHKIVILRKNDPGGREPWKLFQTRRVEMPNVSPLLLIGVERAMFANRKTTLRFNQGVLTDVAVDKGSELVGFVQIPLAVAKAVVDVPGRLVTLRITDTQNQTALLNAQSELIGAIAQYRTVVGADPPRSAPFPRTTGARAGDFYGGCVNAGGVTACEKYAPSTQ
jgi:hypothetical protein